MHRAVLCLALGFISANMAADFVKFTDPETFETECHNKVILDDEGNYVLKLQDNGTTTTPLALLVPKKSGFYFNIHVQSVKKINNHEYRVDLIFKNVDTKKPKEHEILYLAWEKTEVMDRVLYRNGDAMEVFGHVYRPDRTAVFHVDADGNFTMLNPRASEPMASTKTLSPMENGIAYNSTHNILLLDIVWAWLATPMRLQFPLSNVTLGCMVREKSTTTEMSKEAKTQRWALTVIIVAVVLVFLTVTVVALGLMYKFGVYGKCGAKCCKKKVVPAPISPMTPPSFQKGRKNKQGITRPQPLTLSEDKEFDRIRKAPCGKNFIIVPLPHEAECQGGINVVAMTSAEQESLMRPSQSQEPTHDSTGTNPGKTTDNQVPPSSQVTQSKEPVPSQNPPPLSQMTQSKEPVTQSKEPSTNPPASLQVTQSREPVDSMGVSDKSVSKSTNTKDAKNESGKSIKDKKDKESEK